MLFSRAAWSWNAPWEGAQRPRAPWESDSSEILEYSSERKTNREDFFGSLNPLEPLETQVAETKTEIPQSETEEMTEIPWGAHRTLYPQFRFSRELFWPVSGGRLTSGYGIRRGRFHEGLDISAPTGTFIRSALDGKVVFEGTLGSYGKVIVVYHGDGYASVYAHNSVHLKRKGSSVRKGEIIAKVGRTGRAEGDHCHFEMRRDGKPINPLRFSFSNSPLLAKRAQSTL
jgi:murein DD-endopeptidase MepM/ murein hydrolase activator NlpD